MNNNCKAIRNDNDYKQHITVSNCIAYAFWQCYDTININKSNPQDYTAEQWDALHLQELKDILEQYKIHSDAIPQADDVLQWSIPTIIQEAVINAIKLEDCYID